MVTRYELALEKIAKLELLLKESREDTEFWRTQASELEKKLDEVQKELDTMPRELRFDRY